MLEPLLAFAESMMVVGEMSKRESLVALEKPDEDGSNGGPGSTLAERVENLGNFDEMNAGHGGHGLGGGGQGGGCGGGGSRATCSAHVLLPNVVRNSAIRELSRLLSRRQLAPSLPKVDVGRFCPGDY